MEYDVPKILYQMFIYVLKKCEAIVRKSVMEISITILIRKRSNEKKKIQKSTKKQNYKKIK